MLGGAICSSDEPESKRCGENMRHSFRPLLFLAPLVFGIARAGATITTYSMSGTLGSLSNETAGSPDLSLPTTITFTLDTATNPSQTAGTAIAGIAPYPLASDPQVLIGGQPVANYYNSMLFGDSIIVDTGYEMAPQYVEVYLSYAEGTYNPYVDKFQYLMFQETFSLTAPLTSDDLTTLPLLTSSEFVPPLGTSIDIAVPEPSLPVIVVILAVGTIRRWRSPSGNRSSRPVLAATADCISRFAS